MKLFFTFSISLLLFAAGISTSSAQDNWIKKADFQGSARTYAACFSIGGKGYVCGGDTSATFTNFPVTNNLWQYDPATNSWTQKTSIPYSRIGAMSFTIGNKAFVGCGDGGNDVWEYDAQADKWTRKADFPGQPRIYPTAFTIGGKAYAGMGFVWGAGYLIVLKDFWEYDTLSNKWTQIADFAGVPKCYAVGFAIGNKGFVGTGVDSNNAVYNDFWQYDAAKDKWTQKADFGGAARFGAVGFSMANAGYIGFGSCQTGVQNDIWAYDTTSGAWKQMSYCDTSFATVAPFYFAIGNKAYIGSGAEENGDLSGSFWEYTNHTSGINPAVHATDIQVYPNPGSGSFYIQSSYPITSWQVCDINGKAICTKTDAGQANFVNLNLSVPDGLYFLKIMTDTGITIKKIQVINN